MNVLNIFVAGAKNLQEHREKLVLWANNRNYESIQHGKDEYINLYSFHEVGDDQDAYNTAISRDSDVFLLIVEGKLGNKAKEELTIARASGQKNKRPVVLVFVCNQEVETKAYLEGALGRDYTIDFNSIEDLVHKASARIERIIRDKNKQKLQSKPEPSQVAATSQKPEPSQEPESEASVPMNSNWKNHFLQLPQTMRVTFIATFLALVVGLLGSLSYMFVNQNQSLLSANQEETLLLIAGGGSAANFIDMQLDTTIFTLSKYPGGAFVHLPSTSAWGLMADEIISKSNPRKYYPICISAEEATDSAFCPSSVTHETYLERGIVLSCQLGVDSLVVLLNNDNKSFFDSHHEYESGTISVEQLKALVMSNEVNVFTTSRGSGTRDAYCKILGMNDATLDKYVSGSFSEGAPSTVVTGNKPYLLLGSQCYKMKAVERYVNELTVLTDPKPIFIYFMAYVKDKSDDWYYMPKEVLNFLHDIHQYAFDDYITDDNLIQLKVDTLVIFHPSDLQLQR